MREFLTSDSEVVKVPYHVYKLETQEKLNYGIKLHCIDPNGTFRRYPYVEKRNPSIGD